MIAEAMFLILTLNQTTPFTVKELVVLLIPLRINARPAAAVSSKLAHMIQMDFTCSDRNAE